MPVIIPIKMDNKYIAVININNYSGSGISKKLFKVLDALEIK
jgi:D-alanyl-D-alanine carboxypeptidase/D-alanyl-D-alanine-endopeptidase (penicillin-binding protein 4)